MLFHSIGPRKYIEFWNPNCQNVVNANQQTNQEPIKAKYTNKRSLLFHKVSKTDVKHINCANKYYTSEAPTGGVLYKKVFLEIAQNSQKNTCARDSFSIKQQV